MTDEDADDLAECEKAKAEGSYRPYDEVRKELFEIDDCPEWARGFYAFSDPQAVEISKQKVYLDQEPVLCVLVEGTSGHMTRRIAIPVLDAIKLCTDLFDFIAAHYMSGEDPK